MRLSVNKLTMTGAMPDALVSASDILALYRDGSLELSESTAQDFYEQVITPLKSKVLSYCIEFDMASNSYLKNNSVLSKMAKTIVNPNQGDRGKEIEGITNQALNNRKRSTQQMIATMRKGHSLLLDIRKAFTGTNINTKFVVHVEGKTYMIDERYLEPQMMLSAFGGGTISNPFSLSYKIDKELLQSKEFLENAEEITDSEVWNKIFSLKPDYLRTYKTPITGRIYKNYYFDSKDAEIYEHFLQNKESVASLNTSRYAALRKELGGGGGYASPFYKIGDIGSTQVKFFNFKEGQKSVTVNFARFSLLRDRFRELYDILNQDSLWAIGQGMKKFFTEEEERVSSGVSETVNRETKAIFDKIFRL